MSAASNNSANWHTPQPALPAPFWCGTSLSAQTSPGYGSNNLALHVGDVASQVVANRHRLGQRLAVELGRQLQGIAWLDQVHGSRVVEAAAHTLNQQPTADALWTSDPNIGLALLTADCLPLVLVAKQGGCVGIAHAGWRGLLGGVLQNLVAAMPVAPADLLAWGGPCIGVANYEVGLDVVAAFDAVPGAQVAFFDGVSQSKRQLDLHALARQLLLEVGVVNYQASPLCCFDDSGCYSHRRDGAENATGRMATVAALRRAS